MAGEALLDAGESSCHFDKAGAEEERLPSRFHGDAGRQGMRRRESQRRGRKAQPIAASASAGSEDSARTPVSTASPRLIVLPANEDLRLPTRLWGSAVSPSFCGAASSPLFVEAIRFGQVGLQLAESGVNRFQIESPEGLAVGVRTFFRWHRQNLGDSRHVVSFGELFGVFGVQPRCEEADIVDEAAERVRCRTPADSQRLIGLDRLGELVIADVELLQAAIDVDRHAGRLAGIRPT